MNKIRNSYLTALISVMASISQAVFADDIGSGRDNDIPGVQPSPPAETETTTTESTLQQLLELFGLDIE